MVSGTGIGSRAAVSAAGLQTFKIASFWSLFKCTELWGHTLIYSTAAGTAERLQRVPS